MRICVLMGSPRLNGNTAELLKPFIEELKAGGAEVEYITLADKHISSCLGCYACQQVTGEYGCKQQDDMQAIVKEIISSDCLVLATPIYTWYCPPEMKAMLDRHFGMNKFYGRGKGSLWEGKKCTIIATHGYDAEYGAGPFETGIRRLCEHSNLKYMGMYSVRDADDKASFQTEEAVSGAREFARKLLREMAIDEVAGSIGYCGLVCKFCHLADKCGGCKSEHNCCGRHLSEVGCHQYNCCVEKGISGCWECESFPCGEDMFGSSHDVRLRAFVRCAKEEGIGKLAEYVLTNQQKGIIYGHQRDYDGLGSEEAVLKLLRNGRK